MVEGELEVYDEDGSLLVEGKKKLRLCRCGATKIPPFCDGAHFGIPAPESETSDEGSDGESSVDDGSDADES